MHFDGRKQDAHQIYINFDQEDWDVYLCQWLYLLTIIATIAVSLSVKEHDIMLNNPLPKDTRVYARWGLWQAAGFIRDRVKQSADTDCSC